MSPGGPQTQPATLGPLRYENGVTPLDGDVLAWSTDRQQWEPGPGSGSGSSAVVSDNTIYVDAVNGSDANNGSAAHPMRTITAGLAKVPGGNGGNTGGGWTVKAVAGAKATFPTSQPPQTYVMDHSIGSASIPAKTTLDLGRASAKNGSCSVLVIDDGDVYWQTHPLILVGAAQATLKGGMVVNGQGDGVGMNGLGAKSIEVAAMGNANAAIRIYGNGDDVTQVLDCSIEQNYIGILCDPNGTSATPNNVLIMGNDISANEAANIWLQSPGGTSGRGTGIQIVFNRLHGSLELINEGCCDVTFAWNYDETVIVGSPWRAAHAFRLKAKVLPVLAPNGHFYKQTFNDGSGGATTGAVEPTWLTAGGTQADGSCIWQDMGTVTGSAPRIMLRPSITVYDQNGTIGVNDETDWGHGFYMYENDEHGTARGGDFPPISGLIVDADGFTGIEYHSNFNRGSTLPTALQPMLMTHTAGDTIYNKDGIALNAGGMGGAVAVGTKACEVHVRDAFAGDLKTYFSSTAANVLWNKGGVEHRGDYYLPGTGWLNF